ncbi:M56 family metallopeptidase [Bacillus solitudinis]|uniref:M56 family metallopeptidase n=1 Tax=Bacillus solitudinis TaxID=2014074 RepID=UPI000C232684|nr:M56 family metallopeptidase [Bacillus solitudinis]
MMNETMKLILSLSLGGSILALLLVALKPFIKFKLSKTIQYYLWIVVVVRLIFPFSFENSMMNELFYSDGNSMERSNQLNVQPVKGSEENTSGSSTIPKVAETIASVGVTDDVNHRYFLTLFNKYAIYIWVIGIAIALAINLSGYIKFLKYLKRGNTPARVEEQRMLSLLLKRKERVRLVRNRYVSTPMLIGILWPIIIIPDVAFNEKQVKNILLHELTHLRRFDIGVKWLTMIAASIHWFNPLIYIVKKEINHACELACDEAVIKNLNPAEKQAYGETLLSVVAEDNYPVRVLQATMSEEKKSLKERLVAIMNHNKKSRFIVISSAILLGIFISGGLYLGAGVGMGKDTPAPIYISVEDDIAKEAIIGSYSWHNTQSNSDHPLHFDYQIENTHSVTGNQQLIISTQKLNKDKRYNFTIEEMAIYKDEQLVEMDIVSLTDGYLYLQAPPDAGEYIYTFRLNFKDKGIVNYGFKVRVDMLTYNLPEIAKYKTPYIGNNSKVSAIAGNLPVPDNYFQQRFISMETNALPYKLTVYYEPAPHLDYEGEWPIDTPDTVLEANSRTNALVLFAMIDNLDEVTLAYRVSPSNGELEASKYEKTFTFSRTSFEDTYGDLTVFRDDLNILQDVLTGK